ncbi:MAG: metallophosphoesterase [Deltaproteobacteria bacterium]|nr:metallophosphoesterase [Deltaproteobacteria bacterium]
MKLGLVSDTHDNVPMVKRAVEAFNREDVDMVLHAGDYVAPFSLKPFFALECDFSGVWGNNDGDKIAVQKMAQGKIMESPNVETYGEKKILLGQYFETLEALISSQVFFLIIYGHTHRPEIREVGGTLVVNPGECGGWVYGRSTVAVCDLENQTAEIVEL